MSLCVLLKELYDVAVNAVGAECLLPHLPKKTPDGGKMCVLAFGKAAAAHARFFEENFKGEFFGMAITPYGHGVTCKTIEVIEAAHPVPDKNGMMAAERALNMVQGLSEKDFLLVLISGGGSSLMTLPAVGISLEEKQTINRELLKCGAGIEEINCVRKHLSRIKGGRLASETKAQVKTLVVSDVAGDDLSAIASGPTVPDKTTRHDAIEILNHYQIVPSINIINWLNSNQSETPKNFIHDTIVVANGLTALKAAEKYGCERGYKVITYHENLVGDAEITAKELAKWLKTQSFTEPTLILSGGETTVTVKGNGKGGRNSHFLLSLLCEGVPCHALCADTDGIDGTGPHAGAYITTDDFVHIEQGKKHLKTNHSYGFFTGLNRLITTGPTRTNVNDFRAIVIGKPS